MSRYRQVHCCIWNDDKFPFVSDDAKLVFFHLLTTPFGTPFGLFKASIGALADEIRWTRERYSKAFREAFAKGFVKHDERHLLILIPHFLKYNPPGNPNVLISWSKLFYELPDSKLKLEWNETLKGLLEAFGKGFAEAYAKAFAKGMPIQEQEQEQEQSLESPEGDSLSCKPDDALRKDPIPYSTIIRHLNEKAGTSFRSTSEDTRKHIRARWKTGFRLDDFLKVIDLKCDEWLGDAKMAHYLRPMTLFGTKFESYLNGKTSDSGYQAVPYRDFGAEIDALERAEKCGK